MRKGPDRPQKGADQLRTEVSHRERRLHDPDPQRFNVYTQQKRHTQGPKTGKYLPSGWSLEDW